MINGNIKFPHNAVCFACGLFWYPASGMLKANESDTLISYEKLVTFNDFKLNVPTEGLKLQNEAISEIEKFISKDPTMSLGDVIFKTGHFKDGNKYHKPLIGLCGTRVITDVYRVLDAYPTNSSSIDHAVKKLLNAGNRGHKDKITDYENAIESIEQAIQLEKQKLNLDKET